MQSTPKRSTIKQSAIKVPMVRSADPRRATLIGYDIVVCE